MNRFLPWIVSALAAFVCFGLVVTRGSTARWVEGGGGLWALLVLAWLVSILLGVGCVRCYEGIFAPLDESLPWYKLGGIMAALTGGLGLCSVMVGKAWTSSQLGQTSYARDRPDETMFEDMLRVGEMIRAACEEGRSSPETMTELVSRIMENEVALHYTAIREGAWIDPWGRPFHYSRDGGEAALRCGVVLYSFGPNGLDEFREGDDIAWVSDDLDLTDL